MQTIDRNLAFDFGFTVAKRTGALRGDRPEDRIRLESDLDALIEQVAREQGISPTEAIDALQDRYNNVCSRTERHPMTKSDGHWVYHGHCGVCGASTGLSEQPLDQFHRCSSCS